MMKEQSHMTPRISTTAVVIFIGLFLSSFLALVLDHSLLIWAFSFITVPLMVAHPSVAMLVVLPFLAITSLGIVWWKWPNRVTCWVFLTGVTLGFTWGYLLTRCAYYNV